MKPNVDDCEYPTIAEEIERKATDTLLWILEQEKKGNLTSREAYHCVLTTWMMVSGLISEELNDMFGRAKELTAYDPRGGRQAS